MIEDLRTERKNQKPPESLREAVTPVNIKIYSDYNGKSTFKRNTYLILITNYCVHHFNCLILNNHRSYSNIC